MNKNPIAQSLIISLWLLAIVVVCCVSISLYDIKTKEKQFNRSLDQNITNTIYHLNLKANDPEVKWSKSLSKKLNGETEISIPYGRIDIVTKSNAIEVEFLDKWHEGIGQSLHYAKETHKIATLAIIMTNINQQNVDKFLYVNELCNELGINVVIVTK